MAARRAAVIATVAAAAATAVALLAAGGSGTPGVAEPPSRAQPASAGERPPTGVVVGCARRSEAEFPQAFTSSRNVVVGPLALMGAASTPASTVREFGGNKFPLLVKAGHRVTVRLSPEARRSAGLAYGGLGRRPLPEGKQKLRDAADSMTFVACPPGTPSKRYEAEGPSGSYADGEQVTFWSGFVLSRRPRCLPLEVYVDDDPAPRRVGLALGRRCPERAVVKAPCAAGGAATTDVVAARDAVIGPLVLLGARQAGRHRPDAFDRHGYKIPVTVPEGATVTLSVPMELRRRVGLVFSRRAQTRASRLGVDGADHTVQFTACPPNGEPGRTGWPGGIVVDRRRCATLVVAPSGAAAVARRVALGRRC